MIRLLVAEDQALVRGALVTLLSLEPDLEVVAEVGRGDRVVAAALEHRPDVALLDVQMPGRCGLEVAGELADRLPPCRVAIVTTFARSGSLRRAMQVGASGFLLKDTPCEALPDAIRRLAAGGHVIDPALAAQALSEGPNPLTKREQDVLRDARDRATLGQVAAALHLSEGTVRNYVSSAIGKLGVRTRSEAIHLCAERGWI